MIWLRRKARILVEGLGAATNLASRGRACLTGSNEEARVGCEYVWLIYCFCFLYVSKMASPLPGLYSYISYIMQVTPWNNPMYESE